MFGVLYTKFIKASSGEIWNYLCDKSKSRIRIIQFCDFFSHSWLCDKCDIFTKSLVLLVWSIFIRQIVAIYNINMALAYVDMSSVIEAQVNLSLPSIWCSEIILFLVGVLLLVLCILWGYLKIKSLPKRFIELK